MCDATACFVVGFLGFSTWFGPEPSLAVLASGCAPRSRDSASHFERGMPPIPRTPRSGRLATRGHAVASLWGLVSPACCMGSSPAADHVVRRARRLARSSRRVRGRELRDGGCEAGRWSARSRGCVQLRRAAASCGVRGRAVHARARRDNQGSRGRGSCRVDREATHRSYRRRPPRDRRRDTRAHRATNLGGSAGGAHRRYCTAGTFQRVHGSRGGQRGRALRSDAARP